MVDPAVPARRGSGIPDRLRLVVSAVVVVQLLAASAVVLTHEGPPSRHGVAQSAGVDVPPRGSEATSGVSSPPVRPGAPGGADAADARAATTPPSTASAPATRGSTAVGGAPSPLTPEEREVFERMGWPNRRRNEVVGEGRLDDGTVWQARAEWGNGKGCVDLFHHRFDRTTGSGGGGGAGGCYELPVEGGAGASSGASHSYVFGAVTADAHRVVVETADRGEVVVHLGDMPGSDGRARSYWGFLPCGTAATAVVALAADGTELGRTRAFGDVCASVR